MHGLHCKLKKNILYHTNNPTRTWLASSLQEVVYCIHPASYTVLLEMGLNILVTWQDCAVVELKGSDFTLYVIECLQAEYYAYIVKYTYKVLSRSFYTELFYH